MPLIKSSDYQAPFWLPNGHFQTVFPSLFRKAPIEYVHERIDTPDDDFLDLGIAKNSQFKTQSSKLIILSHGLEGNITRQYITGMVKLFTDNGFDCLAWNFRGCSDEMNRQLRFYHSGATDDLETVVKHALSKGYNELYLVGFSLGGNLTLKFLGERGKNIFPEIKKAVTFSVPLNLSSSSTRLERGDDWIYAKRFNRSLAKKVRAKAPFFKEIDTQPLDTIKTLRDFDDLYTSKLHGFKDAEDYYSKNSSLNFVSSITVPTLIVNAKNDPFLSSECFPLELMNKLENVWFESPDSGGHCGFYQTDYQGFLWSELRALKFFTHNK